MACATESKRCRHFDSVAIVPFVLSVAQQSRNTLSANGLLVIRSRYPVRAEVAPLARQGVVKETGCALPFVRDAAFLSGIEASTNTPFALSVARQGGVEALPALRL